MFARIVLLLHLALAAFHAKAAPVPLPASLPGVRLTHEPTSPWSLADQGGTVTIASPQVTGEGTSTLTAHVSGGGLFRFHWERTDHNGGDVRVSVNGVVQENLSPDWPPGNGELLVIPNQAGSLSRSGSRAPAT